MKLLIHQNKRFLWKEKDMHTNLGTIKESVIKKAKPGSIIKSNLKKEFLVLDSLFIDRVKKIKRGPAIIQPKDIGLILTLTGITKESTVFEAGTGSGFMTSFLSNFCKKVISYERKKEFFELAKKNINYLNLKNVELKNKDVYEKITEKKVDLIVLDLPEPWQAINNAYKTLKPSHFLVCYLPTITQVMNLIQKSKNKFFHETTIELIERPWHVEDKIVRPKSDYIPHTAFLVFLRKI